MDFILSRLSKTSLNILAALALVAIACALVVVAHVQYIQFSLHPFLYLASTVLLIASWRIDKTARARFLQQLSRTLVGRVGIGVMLIVTSAKYVFCYAAPHLVYYCLVIELILNGTFFGHEFSMMNGPVPVYRSRRGPRR